MQESSKKIPRLAFPRSELPLDLGETVRNARRARRWGQARLAAKAAISRASVYRLEAGQGTVLADTLFRIAHVLDIGIRELVPTWPEWEPIKGHGHGEALRERRKALDLSLAEMAGCFGVSEATLSRHERGACTSRKIIWRVGEGAVADEDGLARALGFTDVAALLRHVRT